MATGADPGKLGVVASLAQPGGNVTGVTSLSVCIQMPLTGEVRVGTRWKAIGLR